MSQNENTINNDLGKNILILLFVIFVGYILYCEYKNKENFKKLNEKFNKLNENMTNVEKFTGGNGITESIKNLGLLANKIQGANGVLDLSGIDLKVNKMDVIGGNLNIYRPNDKDKFGQLFWNDNLGGFEIATRGASSMRLYTGNHLSIDIKGDKIEISKNIHFRNDNAEIRFKNGSIIKEWQDTGLELWPKKTGGKTGEVHIKGDGDSGKHSAFPGVQSMKFKPAIQEILFNLNSTIKEWPENGVEIWSRNKNGSAPLYAKSEGGKHISLDNRGGYGYIKSNDDFVFGPETFYPGRLETKSVAKRHYKDGAYSRTETKWN